jgi:hypothetical protein
MEAIKTAPGFKPYRTLQLGWSSIKVNPSDGTISLIVVALLHGIDTLKLYTQAHSHKVNIRLATVVGRPPRKEKTAWN